MNTKDEALSTESALKLALDYIVATNKSSQFWLVPESNLNRTVTAIREALALVNKVDQEHPAQVSQERKQQESEAVRAAWMAGYTEGEREAIEKQPAQVPQERKQQSAERVEPVAHCRVRPLRGDQSFPTVEVDWVSRPVPGPLYTSPQPSKPLTDEQISNLWCDVSNTDFVTADTHEFARAIEAAHGIKEKNNG